MRKLLLMAALLCTIVPAAWALDVWDGSVSQPTYDEARGGVVITKGSELAYVHQHWIDEVGGGGAYCTANYFLDDDLDLSAYSWIPMGQGRGALTPFVGTFYGNGHNINLVISDATENYQGLFAEIRKEGHVRDLHVSGSIQCSNSRLVGRHCRPERRRHQRLLGERQCNFRVEQLVSRHCQGGRYLRREQWSRGVLLRDGRRAEPRCRRGRHRGL